VQVIVTAEWEDTDTPRLRIAGFTAKVWVHKGMWAWSVRRGAFGGELVREALADTKADAIEAAEDLIRRMGERGEH
jgi:hypothetical protein